jgi:hypothetical protein
LIPIALKQIIAFTKRDFQSWSSYKTTVITQLINIFIGVFAWGVRASYVQRAVTEMYGSDYISFLIVGVAISNLILPLVQGVERRLNPWTLETILMTNLSTARARFRGFFLRLGFIIFVGFRCLRIQTCLIQGFWFST